MSSSSQKATPLYAITSVDHALRLASILQLEGSLTVVAAAERLGVARSTAHRVLQMLVYRDFACQDELRVYRPGPLLQSVLHSPSRVAALREASLPVVRRLSVAVGDVAEVSARVGDTVRLIAVADPSEEGRGASREGMAFALHHTPAGLLYLASQPKAVVSKYLNRTVSARECGALRIDIARTRQAGFASGKSRSGAGGRMIGVAIAMFEDGPFAAVSVSVPAVYNNSGHASRIVSLLRSASAEVSKAWTAQRQIGIAG